jgi:methionine-rich copper-binding protein CopC
MNFISKKLSAIAVAAALVVAGATAAHAYPAAEGRVGTEYAKVSGTGAKTVIKVAGSATVNGDVLANKRLQLAVTTPAGKKISLGYVNTDENGNYSYSIKNIATKPGVYKVSVTYKGKVTTVLITVKK